MGRPTNWGRRHLAPNRGRRPQRAGRGGPHRWLAPDPKCRDHRRKCGDGESRRRRPPVSGRGRRLHRARLNRRRGGRSPGRSSSSESKKPPDDPTNWSSPSISPPTFPTGSASARSGSATPWLLPPSVRVVTRADDGRTTVALGSVAPTPIRATEAETMISSIVDPTADDLAEFQRLVTEEVRPDHRSPVDRGVPAPRGGRPGQTASGEVSEVIVELTVNGEPVTARVTNPGSLLDLLRDELGLPGSKSACEQGECGSCSVILDGELVCSCLVMAADAADSSVTTVEGVSLTRGCIRSRRRCTAPEPSSVAFAHRASSLPPWICSLGTRTRAQPRSKRPWPGTSAVAPGTGPSSAPWRNWGRGWTDERPGLVVASAWSQVV